MLRTLLRGTVVIPVDRAMPESLAADILIEDGRIAAIRPALAVDEAAWEVIDLAGRVLIPGLVDTHRHLWQSLFRYAGTDWTIQNYVESMWGIIGPAYQPEDMRAALAIGLAEAVDAGCTQTFDWNHNHLQGRLRRRMRSLRDP
jgi:cytosine/adenosine deaminase-related metal-dependent hydrolase